jgi:hypothetical protein
METLVAATENFHDTNKLGQGGFGAVYKVRYADKASIVVVYSFLNCNSRHPYMCRLIAKQIQNLK